MRLETNREANGNGGGGVPPKVVCRQIVASDLPELLALLARGFPARSRAYWQHALDAMSARHVPADCPRYGFVLASGTRLTGVVLLIYSEPREGEEGPRCFLSSWYVEDECRAYASWLISRALKQKKTLYINMSPAPNTRETIVAQGLSRYANGVFFGLAGLAPFVKAKVRRYRHDDVLPDGVKTLMDDHAALGCMCLICEFEGRLIPFVFIRRRIPKLIGYCAQLIYCADFDDFAKCAGPLGRYLLWRALPIIMTSATGPVAGVPGRFFSGRQPQYFRGPSEPGLGDLAYSEVVLFGP